MTPDGLRFDEARHEYRHRGRVLASVTQVLQQFRGDLGRINAETLRAAGERGTAVHRAIELHEARDLDPGSLDDYTAACLKQWERFVLRSHVHVLACEQRVAHPVAGYAGTADIFGTINGAQVCIDLKTCQPHWTHRLQLAGYVDAHRAGGNSAPWLRYGLYLRPDGYTLIPFQNPADFAAWQAALTLFNYRSVHT